MPVNSRFNLLVSEKREFCVVCLKCTMYSIWYECQNETDMFKLIDNIILTDANYSDVLFTWCRYLLHK